MCRICVVYSNGNWSLPQTIIPLFMQQMLAQCIAVNCKIVVFLLKQFSHWTIFFRFSKKPTESLGALCMHFYKCLYLILRFTWPKYFVAGIFSDLSCQRSYKFRIDLYQTMTNFQSNEEQVKLDLSFNIMVILETFRYIFLCMNLFIAA